MNENLAKLLNDTAINPYGLSRGNEVYYLKMQWTSDKGYVFNIVKTTILSIFERSNKLWVKVSGETISKPIGNIHIGTATLYQELLDTMIDKTLKPVVIKPVTNVSK